MIGDFVQDIRYAIRSFGRRPDFALAAVAIVALAIGANTAVFSVVNGILFHPLPYSQPDRLVGLWPDRYMSYRDLRHVADHTSSFAQVAGAIPSWNMALTGTDNPAQLAGARVTANLFSTLGVSAELGRTFVPEEAMPGADNVVVLSNALWHGRFGGDSAIVGGRLMLDGVAHTVVGILPADFEFYRPQIEIWRVLALDPEEWYHEGGGILAVARLRPGVSVAQARGEFRALTLRMRREFAYPDEYGGDADVISLHQRMVGDLRPTLLVLFGAVGFILLIAGANLGNLLLTRAASRTGEIAVRTALGASRARLIRQLLTESVLLTLAGGVGGFLLAYWGVGVVTRALPPDTPRLAAIAVDARVLTVCALLAMGTGLLFGLAPALTAARLDPQRGLGGSRTTTGGAGLSSQRARGLLVTGEVALGMVLLVGAGLMLQSVWRLTGVDPGFRTDHILTLGIQPTGAQFATGVQRVTYYDELFARLEAVSGVVSVGAIQHLPLTGSGWGTDIEVEGRPPANGATPPRVGWRVVGGEYFRSLAIPLVEGRAFDRTDGPSFPPVVAVNQLMAQQQWPGQSALGKRVRARNATGGEWATVIAVVGNVHHIGLAQDPVPELYRPLAQYPHGGMKLVIRTDADPRSLVVSVTDAIWSVDRDVPINDVRSLEDIAGASVARPRLVLGLLAAFALVGLVLSVVGVYSVVAFNVSARTREIGVRVALGAGPLSVIRVALAQGVRLSVLGVAIGLTGAILLTRTLQSMVFEVATSDPFTFAVVALALVAVTVAASYVPARRAARLDPMVALRAE